MKDLTVAQIIDTIEINVPSSPEDREELARGLQEVVSAMVRRKAESDYITEALKALGEKFENKPKHLRKLATMHYNQNAEEVKKESEEITDAYDTIFG